MKNKIREFIYNRYNISFSKSGDDIQLMKLINNNAPGAYVDIGCWHPVKASNSYYFYVRGWKGICIDPNPELKVLYDKFRSKDNFINSGIGESGTSLEYFMLEESSMNTFSKDFLEKHQLESKVINKIDIPLFSLKEILDVNLDKNDRLDFFDIDVEGFDLEVLKTNDWDVYRPKVIVIESDMPLQNDICSDIVQYLELQNYRLIGKSIINGDLGNLFLISN
nr:FkbM family methyltransferase [uncultured Flavobacterium sp.]